MAEQPGKSRTIRIKKQGETPPVVDNAMLLNQYTAIITWLKNISGQLDYIISQPQQPKPNTQSGEPSVEEFKKVTAIWERPEKERLQLNKEKLAKTKPSKGKFYLALIILGIIVLVGVYLWYSYSQNYIFFWQS